LNPPLSEVIYGQCAAKVGHTCAHTHKARQQWLSAPL
jgi:hypothetical protein